MVFLDNTARRPKQSEVISGRINPSPTKTCIAWRYILTDVCKIKEAWGMAVKEKHGR
ncbi:MAG: hypothetical protein FWG87_08495 [Defluviitaleaceae bacterium]|nr:hypothetical protein [Defluviitaleaceae bacterium]